MLRARAEGPKRADKLISLSYGEGLAGLARQSGPQGRQDRPCRGALRVRVRVRTTPAAPATQGRAGKGGHEAALLPRRAGPDFRGVGTFSGHAKGPFSC